MAVQDMVRVLAPRGVLLDTAEPDYGGRIDYPDELSELGKLIYDVMLRERTNPGIGRKMKALFSEAGLKTETGILSSVWDDEKLAREFKMERKYLSKMLLPIIGEERVKHLIIADKHAVEAGRRVSFTPIFWAINFSNRLLYSPCASQPLFRTPTTTSMSLFVILGLHNGTFIVLFICHPLFSRCF